MTTKYEIDPDLSRTAVRYRANETGWSPWCWEIVQAKPDDSETIIGTYPIGEIREELETIQGMAETSEPGKTGEATGTWDHLVERAWLQRIGDAAEKCSKARKPAMPLLRPAKDDRSAAKRRLADLLDATEGYMTWCRE